MGNTQTEEAAKGKSCPFYTPDHDAKCVASKCMAWRWAEGKRTIAFNKAVIALAKEKSITWPKAHAEMLKDEAARFNYTEGYCGGAGFPNQFIN